MEKKTINVITRHAIVNYGSILQAKATEQFFRSLQYDACILDYICEKEKVKNRIKTFSSNAGLTGLKKLLYCLIKYPDEKYKEKKFAAYRKKYLTLSRRYTSLQQLQEADFSCSYLCAGSDQLWGYMPYKQIDPAYFLEFGSKQNTYFSFSASLGRTDFDEAYYRSLQEYLEKFSFITVREQSGVALIEKNTPYQAKHVLDPTLLVGRQFWLDFANKKIKEKPYILLYQLRKDKGIDAYVKQLAKRKGLKIIRVSTSIYDYLRFGKKKILKSPDTVLSLFKHAQYVVTDSFHATVFSLIFNKPFIDFLPQTTHERIFDLLQTVGLQNRIATRSKADFIRIESMIEWQNVNACLEEKAKKSREIIQTHLAAIQKETV